MDFNEIIKEEGSRIAEIALDEKLELDNVEVRKVVKFIMEYSFKDDKEVYTNGTILVPLFRVLDAIAMKGNDYCEGGE